jgi:hypothetical protein
VRKVSDHAFVGAAPRFLPPRRDQSASSIPILSSAAASMPRIRQPAKGIQQCSVSEEMQNEQDDMFRAAAEQQLEATMHAPLCGSILCPSGAAAEPVRT